MLRWSESHAQNIDQQKTRFGISEHIDRSKIFLFFLFFQVFLEELYSDFYFEFAFLQILKHLHVPPLVDLLVIQLEISHKER